MKKPIVRKERIEADIGQDTGQKAGSFSERDMLEIMHDDWVISEALRRMREELKDKGIL